MAEPPEKPSPAVARLLGVVHQSTREAGVVPLTRPQRILRGSYRAIQRLLYERGADTTDLVVGLDHFHPDRVIYYPSGWRYLKRILRRREVGPGDVFVDVGCGKGRVLLQAARWPFKRVVGVEIDSELSATARANIEHHRRRLRCEDVEVITADAAEYAFEDDVTVVYMYFPFGGETFRTVLDNLIASIDRAPREVRLIYALPALADVVRETGRFTLVRESRSRYEDPMLLFTSGDPAA
jgi:SAM-dependent methyltransferase